MKNFLKITIALSFFACRAQTPVLSLYDDEYAAVKNAYYKDTYNDFDRFEGTWQYTNGTTKWTLVLQKKTMVYVDFFKVYEDTMIGEFKYEENGLVVVNTLPQLATPPQDINNHNLNFIGIMRPYSLPTCNDCAPNERRISLSMNDPTRKDIFGLGAELILRRMDQNGTPRIQVIVKSDGGNITYEGDTPPTVEQLSVPYGTYMLTKVTGVQQN